MSPDSTKATGATGLPAWGLLILSAIVYVVAPVEGGQDTGPQPLFEIITLFAYTAVVLAVIGVPAAHRGNSRFGRATTR